MNAGKDRGEVLNGFIYSQEFDNLCDGYSIKAYDSVPPPPPANFNGSWVGQAITTTPFDDWGDPCSNASVSLTISNFQVTGTAVNAWGSYQISGTANSDGTLFLGVAIGSETVANFSGTLSGNTGSGTWSEYWGCYGTWTLTKQ